MSSIAMTPLPADKLDHNKDQEVDILIMTSDSNLSDTFIPLIASHSFPN